MALFTLFITDPVVQHLPGLMSNAIWRRMLPVAGRAQMLVGRILRHADDAGIVLTLHWGFRAQPTGIVLAHDALRRRPSA
ncbi:hypothetical protein EV132_13622 [Rhizobium sullae]|uniref:Uncharacterized protein n=1 Tax=Rhizobium sullae TaxID=50338 RepID=A0A4R3PVX9_RHISU|nr:hypothetical protein EV132_13622 [Rhizobium sullae]